MSTKFQMFSSALLAVAVTALAILLRERRHVDPIPPLQPEAVPSIVLTGASQQRLEDPSPVAPPNETILPRRLERPVPPESISDFWSWSSARQEDVVTKMEHDPFWSQDQRIFMRQAICDKHLSDLARNNIANGLLRQEPPDDSLDELFIGFIRDTDERQVWRDYSVQFLANTISTSRDPRRGTEMLLGLVQDPDNPLAGTAAVQLNILAGEIGSQLPGHFILAVLSIAADSRREDALRGTMMSILADRKVGDALSLARNLARDPSPTIRRSAIILLGKIGHSEDISILRAAMTDEHPLVVLAAKAALSDQKQPLP